MSVQVLWAAAALAAMTMVSVLGTAAAAPFGDRPFCRHAHSGDDPMVSGSGFGMATCNARRAPRYHAQDYGDGAFTLAGASSDPMVWSADRWKSDLFGGYRRNTDDRYDRRFRSAGHARTIVVRKVLIVEAETAGAEARSHGFKIGVVDGSAVKWTVHKTMPRSSGSTVRGMRVWRDGEACENCRRGAVVRPATRCAAGGSLIITWTAGGAAYRCATPRSFKRWVN